MLTQQIYIKQTREMVIKIDPLFGMKKKLKIFDDFFPEIFVQNFDF